jgi:type I restriction enzyme S subunit
VPAYIAGLWGTRHIREQIEAAAKTTNGTYKINQASLASIRFPLPPIDVQDKFAQHYDGACSLRVQQSAATAKAKAAFDALLVSVFNDRGGN